MKQSKGPRGRRSASDAGQKSKNPKKKSRFPQHGEGSASAEPLTGPKAFIAGRTGRRRELQRAIPNPAEVGSGYGRPNPATPGQGKIIIRKEIPGKSPAEKFSGGKFSSGKKAPGKESRDFGKKSDRGRRRDSDRSPSSGQGKGRSFGKSSTAFPRGRGRDAASGGHHGGRRTLKATVDKNRKGFAFLIQDTKNLQDLFIPPHQASELFHGDRVEVTVGSHGRVEDVRVLQHRYQELVGRYTPALSPGRAAGWVVYERKNAREEICILKPPFPSKTGPLKAGDWVRAKLAFHPTGEFNVTGEILEVYGQVLPPSADISMISAESGLVEEHNQRAVEEAKKKTLNLPADLTGRADLRKMPFITIDGETARDFDDAIFVERAKSGYVLWVAIADVSHYVTEGSALDQEARSRGTSVYFPERAFHMLPRELSENLCSLVPHEPRLTLAARMTFNLQGENLETDVMEAVIQSKRRATYNEIQKEWEINKQDTTWEFRPHFELFEVLKKMRRQRGSIEFDLPEAELNVQPNGEVISIKNRMRVDTHRLIEEFMIAANEAVTRWMMKRHWPFVYRIHEEPSTEALQRFRDLADTVGVQFTIEPGASPKVLSDIVQRLEGHPAQSLLNMSLLRSMKQAAYSSTHGIHYGLASDAYTHFTSPIRRYPDLVVHRLLRSVIQKEASAGKTPGKAPKTPKLSPQDRAQLEKTLTEICEHCSYRERLAADAERESIKLKQTRLMTQHLGDEFDAKIVGMVASGLFVQISDPYVEGLVSAESMPDDFYEFNEERMVFFGRRKKRTFRIGDAVTVRVMRADIEKRQIDFSMVDKKNGPEKTTN